MSIFVYSQCFRHVATGPECARRIQFLLGDCLLEHFNLAFDAIGFTK